MKMNKATEGAADDQPRAYRITDFPAACFLLAEGCRFEAMEPTPEPGRKAFVILGRPSIVRRLLESYRSGGAVVGLDSYLAAQRRLKDLLHRDRGVRLRP